MKAEIGFHFEYETANDSGVYTGVLTNRFEMRVTARSTSEWTLLEMFAKRMGLAYDATCGTLTIVEPAQ